MNERIWFDFLKYLKYVYVLILEYTYVFYFFIVWKFLEKCRGFLGKMRKMIGNVS